jgi:hypothetical protein
VSSAQEIAQRLAKRRKAYPLETEEGRIYVRSLNGLERAAYFRSITGDGSDDEKLRADQRMLAGQLCDENGKPIFDDENTALELVMQWDIVAYVKPAIETILKNSGLNVTAQAEAEKK